MKLHLFVLVGLCLAAPAKADLDPSIISADARWVFYADLQAMRNSALGTDLLKQRTDLAPLRALQLDKVLDSVASITIYGTNNPMTDPAPDGVALLQGAPGLRKALEDSFQTPMKDVSITPVQKLPFPAYSISGKYRNGSEMIVAFPPQPVVLIARSKEDILKALAVVTKSADSLPKAPNSVMSQLTATAGSAYMFSASSLLPGKEQPGSGPHARLFQLANAGALAIGEKGPNTYASGKLAADSQTNADKLLKVAQGFTAMLSLTENKDTDIAAFLNAVTVQRQQNSVVFDMSYPSERLLQMLKSLTPKGADSGTRAR